MTRLILNIILLVYLPVVLIGQDTVYDPTSGKQKYPQAHSGEVNDEDKSSGDLPGNKLKAQVQIGTFFGTSFGNEYIFGTYVSPHLSYRLSPRFALQGGMTISGGYGSFYRPYQDVYGHSLYDAGRSSIYLMGAYRMNRNVTIAGTVYKEFNMFNYSRNIHGNSNFETKGMILGVDYRVGRNAYIRGQIEISDGPRGYDLYPFNTPFRDSGILYGNGFNDPF